MAKEVQFLDLESMNQHYYKKIENMDLNSVIHLKLLSQLEKLTKLLDLGSMIIKLKWSRKKPHQLGSVYLHIHKRLKKQINQGLDLMIQYRIDIREERVILCKEMQETYLNQN